MDPASKARRFGVRHIVENLALVDREYRPPKAEPFRAVNIVEAAFYARDTRTRELHGRRRQWVIKLAVEFVDLVNKILVKGCRAHLHYELQSDIGQGIDGPFGCVGYFHAETIRITHDRVQHVQ